MRNLRLPTQLGRFHDLPPDPSGGRAGGDIEVQPFPALMTVRVKQTDIDNGQRPGITTKDQQRILELERGNRELHRANEILKTAAGFFARELDPRLPN